MENQKEDKKSTETTLFGHGDDGISERKREK